MTTAVTEGTRTASLKVPAAGLAGATAMFAVFFAITAWAESAAGEALPMFPPSVPRFLMEGEPNRPTAWASTG